ncbi:MAG: sensor histidine kinase [Fusobacteriaceae bacterium]
MKKFTREVINIFRTMIIVFFVIYFGLIIFIFRYQYKTLRNQIYSVQTFLENEFSSNNISNNKLTFEKKVQSIFKETPKIEGMSIIIKLDNKIFSDSDLKFKTLPVYDKIKNFYQLGNLKESYWVLNKKISLPNNQVIEFQIIKNLKSLYYFYESILVLSITGILAIFFISYIFYRKFYKKFLPQFRILEDHTNKINIENFDFIIDKENFYEEFQNILNAYEKMLQRLKEQTELQTDFVHNASHELKTPIFVLKGYSDLIEKYAKTDENIFDESVSAIKEEIKYIETLIEKLLFISKSEVLTPEISEFNFDDLISEIIQEEKIIHEDQEIKYINSSEKINTDYFLLKQLLRILIDNAIKYGNKNPVKIFTLNNREKNNFAIIIKDYGVGIPEEDLEKIFGKFYRVNKSHSREIGGHGLGLSIAKNISEILKAKIEIQSEFGKGTEIKIIFEKNNIS